MQDTVKLDRYKYIGGSDIPIIMGISPFKSRYDLLLEKAELKENNFSGNVYTEYGNTMEPKIRRYINSISSKEYVEGKHYYSYKSEENNIRIHTDGETSDTILEIKTTSKIEPYLEGYKVYIVQLLFYMYFTGRDKGLLAVYERPVDLEETFKVTNLKIYEILLSDYKDLLNEIIEAVDQFLKDLDKVKHNPFITEAELLPNDITSITNRILKLEDRLKAYKEIEAKIKEEKENLRQAMISYNVKSWETPNNIKITLVADSPESTVTKEVFNEDKLKEEQPELYNSYVESKEVTKKGRKGYVKITLPKEA